MDSKHQEQADRIKFRMHRCGRLWRYSRKIAILLLLSLLFWLGHQFIPNFPQLALVNNASSYVVRDYRLCTGIGVLSLVSLSLLLRRRYFIIDRPKGMIYYSLPIIGRRCYYFVEVCAAQFEVDMSQVLLRLKSQKLHRVYLQLRNQENLLISEDFNENRAQKLCYEIERIFQIEVEHLQRIGRRRGAEINLGNYILEKELSHGGMGKVFLAKDKKNDKKVALKVLPASLALDGNYVTSFAREIRILQKLNHPGIVKILNVGRDTGANGDVYFYAMQFIEGRSLSELIAAGELSVKRSALIAMQVALALDYSHKHRVIHRDIKPSNIMVRQDGQAVLIDFGIARDVSSKPRKRRTRRILSAPEVSHYVGTLPYMSPEQLSSKHSIDYRTDIFSLGTTFYEMLTGQRSFRGSNQTICRSIMSWHPPEPSSVRSEIPEELDIITMKAMEKDKIRRYQSGAQMAEDLRRWHRGEPILSRPISRWARAWRRFRSFFRWF